MNNDRALHLEKFYELLADLEKIIGEPRKLSQCTGRMDWPEQANPQKIRGVYFFQEDGESRNYTRQGPRIVRVGTHALRDGSSTTLCKRLRQHKGTPSGSGNHRASVFRRLIGDALIRRDNLDYPTWEQGKPISKEVRERELPLERKVSSVIGDMPFLWLAVNDEPGPESDRGYIERNAIALLSNFGNDDPGPPSSSWLGQHCSRKRVSKSRLWNSNHVSDNYDPDFLKTMEYYIRLMDEKD